MSCPWLLWMADLVAEAEDMLHGLSCCFWTVSCSFDCLRHLSPCSPYADVRISKPQPFLILIHDHNQLLPLGPACCTWAHMGKHSFICMNMIGPMHAVRTA